MARAQKCGGVHKNITANKTHACHEYVPVIAAQPISGPTAPAAPPITIF